MGPKPGMLIFDSANSFVTQREDRSDVQMARGLQRHLKAGDFVSLLSSTLSVSRGALTQRRVSPLRTGYPSVPLAQTTERQPRTRCYGPRPHQSQ